MDTYTRKGLYAYIHECIGMCAHISACVYTCMYKHVHIHMHAYSHVCTHVSTHNFILKRKDTISSLKQNLSSKKLCHYTAN